MRVTKRIYILLCGCHYAIQLTLFTVAADPKQRIQATHSLHCSSSWSGLVSAHHLCIASC